MDFIATIRKKVLFYSTLVNLILGIFTAMVVILPLYLLLEKQNENDLTHLVRSRLMLTQQVTRRMADVAVQITSRSKIRQKLMAHNQGLIGQKELYDFSYPLLNDARVQSDSVVGITRFNRKGQIVVDVGVELPFPIKDTLQLDSSGMKLYRPLRMGSRYVIPVEAPILDRGGGYVGTDVVLFQASALQKVTTDYSGLGETGQVFIGTFHNNEFTSFYITRFAGSLSDIQKPPRVEDEMEIYSYTRNGAVYRVAPIENTDWYLAVSKEYEEINQLLHFEIIMILVVVLVIVATGITFTVILISPLLRKIEEELQNRIYAENSLKRKRNELADLNRHLEERVSVEVEKSRENEQLLIQQSKLASMGEMLGAIAHQWRQPLNTLSLIVQDVKEAYDEGELNKDYIQRFTGQSLKLIFFMSNTINEFRSFFRPSREKSEIRILQAIQETVHIISGQFENNNIDVETTCEKNDDECENLKLYGFPNEFKFVILSILSNAKEAIVENRRERRETGVIRGSVRIVVGTRDSDLTIVIEDNGTGIPDEIRHKIFDPYFTTRGENRAVGIGLYMAEKIIQRNYYGTIQAENRKNHSGARIIISIPMLDPIKVISLENETL